MGYCSSLDYDSSVTILSFTLTYITHDKRHLEPPVEAGKPHSDMGQPAQSPLALSVGRMSQKAYR